MLGLDKSLHERRKTRGGVRKGQEVQECGKFPLKERVELKGTTGVKGVRRERGIRRRGETKKELKASREKK